MSALRPVLAALRRRWFGVGQHAPVPSEAEVLRGVGLARSEHVFYEVCASGRVKVVHQPATPDAAHLRACRAEQH